MPLLPSFAPLPSATPPMPPNGALSQAIRPLAGQAARNTTLFQPAKAKLPATAKAPAAPKVFDAAAMQRFLNAKGFAIPVDGVNGPLTQAAGAAFRSHADPQAFNVGHNLTAATSPGTAAAGAPPSRVAIPASVTGQYKQPAGAAPRTGGGAPVLPSSVFTQPAAGASNTGAAGASSGHGTSSSGAVTDPALAAIQTLIKQAQQGALAQGRQGQSLINGYSTSAQNELKGIDFGQPYQQAAGEQNAINTALMAALQGQGGTLQDQLGAQLAASGSGAGSPLSAALTGALGTSTAGASAANLAGGDAQLSSIIQSGQAARNYGNSLPGITALAGLQDTKALQGSVGANEAKTVAGLEAKVPGLLQSETAANTRAAEFASTAQAKAVQDAIGNRLKEEALTQSERKEAAALIIANNIDPTTGLLTPTGKAQLRQLTGVASTGVAGTAGAGIEKANQSNATRIGIANQATGLKQSEFAVTSAQAAAKITLGQEKLELGAKPKLNASVSRALGYAADQYGNPVGKHPMLLPGFGFDAKGNIVKASTSSSGKVHGFTPTQFDKLSGTAVTLAQNAEGGFTDSKGVAHPALSYDAAILEAQKEGLPAWVYLPALNRFYTPGQQGRPQKFAHVGPTGPLGLQATIPLN